MGNICETADNIPFQFNFYHFYEKNLYSPMPSNRSIDSIKKMLDPQNKIKQQKAKQFEKLCLFIANKQTFKDPNFKDTNAITMKLPQLYNFERQKIKEVYQDEQTKLDCFEQANLQFTYLSAVFYEICKNPTLKNKIFITQQMRNNPYHAYILNLFCNGQQTWVAVDDSIPIQNSQNPFYTNVTKGRQLWPYLLQKAWCKQIGSYEKAKGLSPQDAFQQITGIPSYSYFMKDLGSSALKNIVQSSKQQGFWVCITGTTEHSGIKNRQVFFLEDVRRVKVERELQHQFVTQFLIRSPFLDFTLKEHKNKQNKSVYLNLNELISSFEYITIGHVMKDYSLSTFRHKSDKRQDRFYELRLIKQDWVNIRFIQFYEEYLQISALHSYSPVFLQLYNDKHQLMYQGCPKSVIGNRSSHLTEQVFMKLQPGFYYLRVEVDWMFPEVLSEGNIVIYGRQTKIFETAADYKQLSNIINKKLLNNVRVHELPNSHQNLIVKTFEKENGYLVQIRNANIANVKIVVDMSKSRNIRLRGQQLNEDKKLYLNIESTASYIMEVLPERPSQYFELAPIDITKL